MLCTARRSVHWVWLLSLWGSCALDLAAGERPAGPAETNGVVILEIGGTAEFLAAGGAAWKEATVNQVLKPGDRFRTRKNSRATIRLSDLSQLRVGELSELEVRGDPDHDASPIYKLWKGVIYFFHRDKPGRFRFDTPIASAAVRGTEFTLVVEEADRTVLTLLDGEVELSSDAGRVSVKSGQQAVAERGQPPTSTALIAAQLTDTVQWVLYYPAVLHPDETGLSPDEQGALRDSLAAYRTGDLLAALARYPPTREAASDAERVYRAGLLLAVGQVEQAEAMILSLGDRGPPRPGFVSAQRLGNALRRLIAAVKGQPVGTNAASGSATEWLVESYVQQARSNLPKALAAARQVVAVASDFSFGWARVAELEFGFGESRKALLGVDKALALSPRNAQALALRGFLLSAQNRTGEALAWFNRAIQVDGALGSAWLGRGLCLIRQGDTRHGLLDLQTAAVLEPQRSVLRSYLGKGYETAGLEDQATRELALAKKLDARDPTSWLYSALLKREQNRVNQAVEDLETSVQLNDRRAVYRSRFLLDEDRAVRSSSLANVYQTAGMPEVSVREAARAASDDYANYSAHLFLSDSFNALRDPTRFNLRYETVWFNELLLANLLSPVGGTPLSQQVSQQEYSRLFERDRIGLRSSSEFRSDGQFLELSSQFGTIGNTAWSLDLDYQHNDGVRVNNGLDRIEWYTTVKQQLNDRDSLLLLTKYQDYHAGDNFQYYDPSHPRPFFRYDEYQSPIAIGGFHREWSPGVHTLLLGGRLENDQRFRDRNARELIIWMGLDLFHPPGEVFLTSAVSFDADHRSKLEIYTGEAQQIFENEAHTLLLGGRWQGGDFDTHSVLSNPSELLAEFHTPAADIHAVDDFERISGYGYETLKLPGRVHLTGGLTYEYMEFPSNFRAPPIRRGVESRERLTPKAALVWDPLPQATLRGTYTRSLGGVSFDESFRLEPTQLGGFSQAFRTLIPESLIGSVAAPDHEVWGAALDLRFKTRTYIGLQGEILRSQVHQTVGAFDFLYTRPEPVRMIPSSTRQHLNYEERAVTLTLNQLVSDEWSLGAQYSFVGSELQIKFPALPDLDRSIDSTNRAELHRLTLSVLYNHPSGFFAQAESQWYFQETFRSTIELPGDSIQQLNFYVGYRFPRQYGDLTVGILDALGEDYRLNPVTPYQELPRERVVYARLRFRF